MVVGRIADAQGIRRSIGFWARGEFIRACRRRGRVQRDGSRPAANCMAVSSPPPPPLYARRHSQTPAARSHFDLIINCSVIEHVGLAGRYGVTEDLLDGDLDAMERLKMLLKPEGIMLLTIPVGKDAVFPPLHRVYGEARLPLLLSGYIIEKEQYWTKDMENKWIPVTKKEALNRFPQERLYGLGCFILKRKGD